MKNLLETALQYHRAGLRVVPVKDDKRPTVAWKQYQTAQNENDVLRDFSAPCWGIAVLTGINGLEVIDIDCKYDLTGKLEVDFYKACDELNGNNPPVVSLAMSRTKSGGYHLFYRCDEPGNNMKLAKRPATESEDQNTTPVLIETRGVGGYVVVAPSPGYEMQFGELCNIPTITQQTRNTIIQAARSFDELPEPVYEKPPRQAYTPPPTGTSVTPWDDYNDRVSPIDVLQTYGWTAVYQHGEKVFMKRPGKTDAKTSGNYHEGRKVFVCHTTSTPLPAEKGLTAWSIYKHYAHGGDAVAAAKQLYADGYGTRYERVEVQPQAAPVLTPEAVQEKENDLIAKVWATRFDFNAPIREEDAILTRTSWEDDKTYKVGGYGQIGFIVGEQKSGKTFVLRHMVASALAKGSPFLSFSLRLRPMQNIIFFDTEQSEYFFKYTQRDMQELAGVCNPPNYYAFHLRRFTKAERVSVLRKIVDQIGNVGLIVIDGIVDLCEDIMDYKTSSDTIQDLMTLTDETKALVLTVLHLTKQNGFMRGHIGTEGQNRCDFAMEVSQEKESGWYKVKCRETRFAPWPVMTFTRDPQTGRAIRPDNEVKQSFEPDVSSLAPASAMANHAPKNDEDIPW